MLKQATDELKKNKMTPTRILEIYEDLLNRYKQYTAGEEVEFPYDKLPGVIHVHLPPINGRTDDREKFKGEILPDYVDEVTVIATVVSSNWDFPVHVLDKATEEDIRDVVSDMLFPDGNSAEEFLDSQEF